MDLAQRRELARQALAGYATGPAATVRATASALTKLESAAGAVLVEGISDQIALEAVAKARGRDLDAERVVIVPIGGAHAMARFRERLGPGVRVAALCDRREEAIFRRGLGDLPHLGLFVCVDDLEDELIRAVGTAGVEALFDAQGDLGSFRTLQSQPAWRGRALDAQMRRFLGSGSRRKSRYARLLVETAIERDVLPGPLDAVLAAV